MKIFSNTFRPFIYGTEDNETKLKIVEALKEIGIRIEDNILVTDTGYENLSEKIPNDPNELENLIGTHL